MTTKASSRRRALARAPGHVERSVYNPNPVVPADAMQARLLRKLMRKARKLGITAQQALDMHARGEL